MEKEKRTPGNSRDLKKYIAMGFFAANAVGFTYQAGANLQEENYMRSALPGALALISVVLFKRYLEAIGKQGKK